MIIVIFLYSKGIMREGEKKGKGGAMRNEFLRVIIKTQQRNE